MEYDIFSKEIIIPITAAILSIALPMIISVIQRIDDKYNSTRLIRQFVKEPWTKIFLGILIVTIISLFYLLIAPPNFWQLGWFTKYVNKSAIIIASLSCIVLIACLFMVLWLIYVYNDPIRLQNRLVKPIVTTDKRKAWLELFIAMLKSDNTDIIRSGYQYLYEWCMDARKGYMGKMIEYPSDLYEAVIIINEQLCQQKKKVVSIENGNDIIKIFFDSAQDTVIHPKTYRTIWICLSQQLSYNRTDWVMTYWAGAHQYLIFNLPRRYEGENIMNFFTGKNIKVTAEQAQQRNAERKEFLDFHIALGGLLLYTQKYDLLKQILYYSNTQPPQYVLVPGSFAEIFVLYMELVSFAPENMLKYESKYPFLDLQAGVRNDNIIIGWIQQYLILLMLRLYTLDKYSVFDNFFQTPAIPQKLTDKKGWFDNLDIIKRNLKNNSLSEWVPRILPLKSENITEKLEKLDQLVESLKEELKVAIEKQMEEQELSPDELKSLNLILIKETKEVVDPLVELFSTDITKSYTNYTTKGRVYEIQPTEAFANDKTMSYINFKEALGQLLVREFWANFLRTFQLQKATQYRVFSEKIQEAIQRMNLDKERHVILGFGVNWYSIYEKLSPKSDNLFTTPDRMQLYSFRGEPSINFVGNIVIMNRQDLPQLYFENADQTFIDYYQLQCINEKYGLYSSVIKLNERSEIMEEVQKRSTHTKEELRKSVLVCAELGIQTRWKLNVPMVIVKVLHQFRDNGDDNLSDIRPFE